jgi:hypothetical protein
MFAINVNLFMLLKGFFVILKYFILYIKYKFETHNILLNKLQI